jgi:glycosyltransferase involved in cell wall biosynthesis
LEILYISTLCSPQVGEYLFKTSTIKLGQEAQKYHRLLVEGMAALAITSSVKTLSSIPVTFAGHPKKIWNLPSEINGKLVYNYVPFVNLPVIRNVFIFFCTFFSVLIWCIVGKKREQKIVICDVLNLTSSLSAFLATFLTGTRVIAIVTDIPDMMTPENCNKQGLKRNLYNKIVSLYVKGFIGYVLMTEKMNEVVNPRNKPFLVIEGIVDVNMSKMNNSLEKKDMNRVVIYAGGIFEKYGIKKLIEAFSLLPESDLRLHIYGTGEMEQDMHIYTSNDSRVIYKGLVLNKEIINAELKATLLVNPRSSSEVFASYSFPSKNMEYMVSGTPVLTTVLPAMPVEYHEFVHLIKDESIEGIANVLHKVLNQPKEELHSFGDKARQFVLTHKSNLVQAERLINFVSLLS